MTNRSSRKHLLDRRSFLKNGALAAGALATGAFTTGSTSSLTRPVLTASEGNEKTRFLHACMTLPYRNFPLERALTGIKSAGYDHVAWGTEHREEDGEDHAVMPTDAHPDQAAELGRRCRDLGLEPVKMFSSVYPDHDDAIEVLTNRIRQAAAAGIKQVLTFGNTRGGDPKVWMERFKELGPIAADYDVTLVMKQHGGQTTGTGEALAKIVREVDHPNVWMSYDAGNTFWYQEVDPIPDIQTCTDLIRGFCLKDARSYPSKATNGPGYGDIDHYRLFAPVAFTGHTMPLAYENIFPPYIDQPTSAEQVDQYARHAREFMENVIKALQKT
ncbi:MAG: sugar phosphate isomerase/epimerase [Balneolales bacterium]